jgi:predicted O-methyltransferase YrrM
MIKSKLNTILWYLRQPKFYKQLFVLMRRILLPHPKEKSGNEAKDWCEGKYISTAQMLSEITGSEIVEFRELFTDIYAKGESLTDKIPVKMGGPGNLTLLYYLTKNSRATRIVETGIAYGWSSLALLQAIHEIGTGRLVSTDMPYAKMNNEEFVGLVVPEHLRSKWQIVRLPDVTGLPKALKEFDEIDLCHYDSDKSYIGRMWAYPRLWKVLRSGGYLVSDDISDNLAFKEFSEKVGVMPIVIKMPSQYVGLLVKP